MKYLIGKLSIIFLAAAVQTLSAEKYKYYRWGCGRDKRLKQIWGDRVTTH